MHVKKIHLKHMHRVASVLKAVTGENGSHPGLIVALAGSLHGIIEPGWPTASTRQTNADRRRSLGEGQTIVIFILSLLPEGLFSFDQFMFLQTF